MTSVTWKCYWKTGALTYPESGREGEGACPAEGGRTQLHRGRDGLVSTCKQGSEPQALLAVGNPTRIYNNSLHRCSTEVRAIGTFVGIWWDILQPLPASAWENNIRFSSLLVPFWEMLPAKIALMWPEALGSCCFLLTNTGRPHWVGGLCSGCREGNMSLKAFRGPLCWEAEWLGLCVLGGQEDTLSLKPPLYSATFHG